MAAVLRILRESGHSPRQGECIGNALEAALHLYNNSKYLASILNVYVPNRGPHAYLELGNKTFSNQVTWPNTLFPEIPARRLREMPFYSDITLLATLNTLTAMTSDTRYITLLGVMADKDIEIRKVAGRDDLYIEFIRQLTNFGVDIAYKNKMPKIAKSILDLHANAR